MARKKFYKPAGRPPKKSPGLILKGEPSPEIKKLLKTVKKNSAEPTITGKGKGKWDHLINGLRKKDTLELPTKKARSIAHRARKLGYVVRLKTLTKKLTELWFGGFQGIPKEAEK